MGAASRFAHDDLEVGSLVKASAPRGAFTLSEGSNPVVLISAGIGITPVLAMLQALAAQRSIRQIWWLYGARNGRQNPFADEVRGLLQSLAHTHSLVCYSAPDLVDRKGVDYDLHSRLDVEALKSMSLPTDGEFYLCGPSTFMADIACALSHLGVPSTQVHTEAFGGGKSFTPGIAATVNRPPHAPDGAIGSGPTISFSRSGVSARWNSTFANLLEFTEACDVPARWSCRSGVCHSCETAMISGAVSYQPFPLDKPAEGNILLCCSQPTIDMVIDL